ncbi:hypothetical protein CH333_06650 [candidate division WOR-3 bacterium JGI_Cruoil_03_44_89]|uniref:Uncharacterized protein n=1 Tax=candidate division WOR-3 bacterium JGI_Cruoil_03_44_89 TaxID=1973748 RepID=A0A235BS90_UNCW3|nr:MAG: hypothetical protein CH333_06650 [candidate division WOR-3 bacterium JGI_Cruoil_03_44_89]
MQKISLFSLTNLDFGCIINTVARSETVKLIRREIVGTNSICAAFMHFALPMYIKILKITGITYRGEDILFSL